VKGYLSRRISLVGSPRNRSACDSAADHTYRYPHISFRFRFSHDAVVQVGRGHLRKGLAMNQQKAGRQGRFQGSAGVRVGREATLLNGQTCNPTLAAAFPLNRALIDGLRAEPRDCGLPVPGGRDTQFGVFRSAVLRNGL
jgi:hypothetical protein